MGTHWECPDNRQFVSSMSWVLIGVSCQSSICLQYVMGTHWECPDNRQFVSIMSWVLSVDVLSIVYLSPLCHGTYREGHDNRQFFSIVSWVLTGVSWQSSICLHCVMGTHWSVLSILYLSPVCHGYSLECLVNPLFVSIVSWVLIGSVLTIVIVLMIV